MYWPESYAVERNSGWYQGNGDMPHSFNSLESNGVFFLCVSFVHMHLQRSHMLYDQRGDQHYNIISALHKSIRASDDNAALYWCTRMMVSGEDPRFICRRMIRAASEDIGNTFTITIPCNSSINASNVYFTNDFCFCTVGLADPNAVSIAIAALDAVQSIGMPEADCIIAQCAVYLARAPKSQEVSPFIWPRMKPQNPTYNINKFFILNNKQQVYRALGLCKRDIEEYKGPQPAVPLHLRNAPTKLMRDLSYGKGYNMRHKDDSGLEYMPEGMEDRNYF